MNAETNIGMLNPAIVNCRVLTLLSRSGIDTMGKLVFASDIDIMKVKGIGYKSLCKIETALNQVGIGLRWRMMPK